MADNELNRIIRELQLLQAQANELQERIQMSGKDLIELEMTIRSMNEIKGVNPGKETFMPLGSGVWLRGTIADNTKVLTDVGAGIVTERTIEEAVELTSDKKKQLKIIKEKYESDLSNIAKRAGFLQGKAQKLAEKD